MKRSQSILEYLGFLVIIICGITIGTKWFGEAAQRNLDASGEYLRGELSSTVDDTYKAEEILYPDE